MHSQFWVRFCAGVVLVAAIASGIARAQVTQSPHDALLELYFSETQEAVERHLLNSTKEQLQQLDPSLRQLFFDVLMIRKAIEMKSGVVSKRGEGHTILVLQSKDANESLKVTMEKEEINGDSAVIETILHRTGAPDIPVTFRLRKEEGVWRLARAENPDDDSFLGQLDSPQFVDTLKKMASVDRVTADQASAVASLRTINTAEVTYFSTYPKGFSPDLKSLGGSGKNPTESGAGLIDETLASGRKSGYMFTYAVGPKDKTGFIGTYSVVARPDTYGKTGKWSYFTDQSGVIRGTQEDRAATAGDPPL